MKEYVMQAPYLLFLGDAPALDWIKTAAGLAQWRPELCAGQYRLKESSVGLGLPDLDFKTAHEAGVRTMVLGIANDGGLIAEEWVAHIVAALEAGLDVAAGLHERLDKHPVIAGVAVRTQRKLYDLRQSDQVFKTGTGEKRSGKRLLTVGVDCAVGKKYTALALHRALCARGVAADFCPTGQTGIMITGRGIAIDSVVADFIAGAAEWLSPAASADHWHVIEGQGSLLHPAFAGVTMGLVHGSQPDAIVVCHEAGRTHLTGYDNYPSATLTRAMKVHVEAAKLTNPDARGVGISLNTSHLPEDAARSALAQAEDELGLPACDPVRWGAEPIVDALLS